MNVRSLKLAGAAAGLLVLIGAAPNVYAQTAVLNVDSSSTSGRANPLISTFTFNQSLILNSIGIPDLDPTGIPNFSGYTFYYKIGAAASYTTITDTLGSAENGFRYFTFSNPQTYAAGTTVSIYSSATVGPNSDPKWYTRTVTTTNAVGVTHTNVNTNLQNPTPTSFASGNIKVSNPSSNVAPEPGSIALLLTGGGALAGIALRRRRNAG